MEALRALAERLGVGARVHFLGTRADVPSLLARAHIVCHPARQEGMPNAVPEAMAAARPIVTTPAGGAAELVRDGVDGVVVPTCAPERLAAGILELHGDAARRARLARSARRRVEDSFRSNHLAARVAALYDGLLEGRT